MSDRKVYLLGAVVMTILTVGVALAVGRVYPSAEEVQPLQPGARIPSVRVETLRGEPVDLAATLEKRGALLVFYRGGW